MNKKYSELNYIELVKEYKLVDENTNILKKDIILEMAKRKEIEEIPKPQIVKIIIDDLKDYANDDYIRKVLRDYTDKRFDPTRNKQKEESKKKLILTDGKIENEKPPIIDFKNAVEFIPPIQNSKQDPKEIEKTINSLYQENKNPANDSITQEDKETWEKLTSMEILEQENIKLKSEIQELKAENLKLKDEIKLLKQPRKITKVNARDEYEKNKYYRLVSKK